MNSFRTVMKQVDSMQIVFLLSSGLTLYKDYGWSHTWKLCVKLDCIKEDWLQTIARWTSYSRLVVWTFTSEWLPDSNSISRPFINSSTHLPRIESAFAIMATGYQKVRTRLHCWGKSPRSSRGTSCNPVLRQALRDRNWRSLFSASSTEDFTFSDQSMVWLLFNLTSPNPACKACRELRQKFRHFRWSRNKVHRWATDKDSPAAAGNCWLGTCPATLPQSPSCTLDSSFPPR